MAAIIAAEVERITTDVAASVAAGADATDEPIEKPLSIVVFGATGDLAREKLYPSFRKLMAKGLLPYGSTIMACVSTAMLASHTAGPPRPRLSPLSRKCRCSHRRWKCACITDTAAPRCRWTSSARSSS